MKRRKEMKKLKKLLTGMMAVVMVFGLLTGCGSSSNSGEDTNTETTTPTTTNKQDDGEKTPLIGYSLNSMDSTMKLMADFFEETAKANGWEPVLLNANGDVSTELTNVESLINMKCDVVVIMGCDTEGSAPAVEACGEAGIPCIIAGRKIAAKEDSYYTLVSGNHHLAGEVQGAFINDFLKANPDANLNVGFIYGQSGSSSVEQRYEGFKDSCLDNADNAGRINLMAEQYAEFDAEKAYNITTDMLQTYPEINCFVTQSDDQVGGIINAIKAQGQDVKEYLIVSIDCSETGITYLNSDELDATVLMAMRQLAVSAADYAGKAMAGESVSKESPIENYYQLATKENLEEVLAANGLK